MTKFSDWLERMMFERGGRKYGPTALARDLGIRPATVTEWSTIGRIPDRTMIQQIAVHFGTTSRHIYGLLGETPPEGLNDDEEVMVGLIKQLERDGHADNFIRVILEKAAKGELSDATKSKVLEFLAASREQSGVHAGNHEPVAAPKRKKA
jgi:hypothetical protein